MYKVTVSVENEKYCGEFTFSDSFQAAQKVVANIDIYRLETTEKIDDSIRRNFSNDSGPYFLWCNHERGSFCKVERI